MWELAYKESWTLKNWCFWTVALEKTLESPLDCKEIQSVRPQGDQSWVFIGRTDAEAETPILWPPDVKGWLIWKDPDAGKDWGQEEKGMTEDEMVGWHHEGTRWIWVWVDSRSWWWTGRPSVLRFMELQRFGHDWVTELNWTDPTNVGICWHLSVSCAFYKSSLYICNFLVHVLLKPYLKDFDHSHSRQRSSKSKLWIFQ